MWLRNCLLSQSHSPIHKSLQPGGVEGGSQIMVLQVDEHLGGGIHITVDLYKLTIIFDQR